MADTAGTPRAVFMLVCPAYVRRRVPIHLVNTSLAVRLRGLMAETGVELANGDVALRYRPPRERTIASVGLGWRLLTG
jgi:hypothetical protein